MQNNLINDEQKQNLKINTMSLLIIQAMNYLIPFITLPYLSRIFSVEKFGLIFFAQSIVDYFARFIMFGFEISAVREIAIIREDKEQTNKIFNSVFCAQILLFLMSLVVFSIIIFATPKFRNDFLVYILVFLPLIGSVLSSTWFYQGMEKMKFITVLNLIAHTIGIILTFTFIKKADDYYLWLEFGILIQLIISVVSIFFIKKIFNIKYSIAPIKEIWKSLKCSCQFFLSKISVSVYMQINIIILGFVGTTVAVAYYASASKIFYAALSVYYTFTNALFPYMSKNKDKEFFKKVLKYVVLFGILANLGLFFLAKPVILFVYSEKYFEAVRVLQILSFSFIFNVLVVTLGYSFLGAYGYIKETNRCYWLGAIYNTTGLLILYLTNQINIINAAILLSSTFVVMFLHRVYYIWKYKLFDENTD